MKDVEDSGSQAVSGLLLSVGWGVCWVGAGVPRAQDSVCGQ